MATDTAALAPPTTTARDHRPDPTRHMWQLPLLLVGVGGFVAAWQGWLPVGRGDAGATFARDVATLKTGYEKVTPDAGELKTQLNRVAAGVDSFPDQASLARFHLGSGYVRLAELTAAPDEAHGYWTLAHQHFQLVKPDQIRDPADQPKLAYRAAKARAAVGLPADTPSADITLLITVLTAAPPPGEYAGETQRLVAELALRQNPPDTGMAKAALNTYLTATGIATPEASLARAKLRLGDLYLRSREYDQALKWLGQIGPDAPPDVLPAAKAELAQVLMAQSNWTAAAKEWETLRSAPGVPSSFRTTAAFQLGLCKLKTRDEDAAVLLFQEAAGQLFKSGAKSESEEASAAAIYLAGLHLNSPDPARHAAAVDLLVNAVKGEGKYTNSQVLPSEVQAVFELAVTVLLADGACELALKAAEAYAAVAPSGHDREKRADVLAAWGESLQKIKQDGKPKYKAAADEFAALAALQPRTEGKLEMLRRAAKLYRLADQPATAVTRLNEAVKLPDIPEALVGVVWVELADALLAANRPDEVWRPFQQAMASVGTMSTATRYRLARQFLDSRHPGLMPLGRGLFEQIAKQQNVTPEEQEYHERALTELANDLIRQGHFADAEVRLRTQLDMYKQGGEADLARLLLGVCLLQRASAPGVTAADALRLRTEAVMTFKQIVAAADATERRNRKLTDREAWLRKQAALRVLQSYEQMQQPENLLFEAEKLLGRYRGTVDELIILSLVYRAYKQLKQTGKALDIRDRMKEAFDRLGPKAFPLPTGEYSRDYWLKVWFAPDPK